MRCPALSRSGPSLASRSWLVSTLLLVGASTFADTVSGYVLHGDNGEPVGDVEVAFLTVAADGSFDEILRKRSDGEGRIVFSGPFLTPELTFVLVPVYRSIPYPTQRLRAGGQKQIILEVFEPGGAAAEVAIVAHHLFLVMATGSIEVSQFLEIENRGRATHSGSGKGQQRHVTRFELPAGLFNMQSLAGDLIPADGGFFDTQPLPPGNSTIAFSFQIDPDTFTGEYAHVPPYVTEQLSLYIQPADVALPPSFLDLGEVSIHERSYRRYHLDELAAAETVVVPLPVDRQWRWVMKWLAVCSALMPGLAMSFVGRSSKRVGVPGRRDWAQVGDIESTASRAELEQIRSDLLSQLVALPEQETLSRKQRARRDSLLRRAIAVYHLLDSDDASA